MDKNFQFQVGFFPNIPDLRQGEFPGQNYPGNPIFGKGVAPPGGGNVHLGGGVEFKGRKIIPSHSKDPKILYDYTVRAQTGQIFKELIHPVGFPLLKNGIYRYINLPSHPVQGPESPFKLGIGKIGASHPGVKTLKPQVNPVGPLPYRSR
jgi:hypothetical protein